MVVYTADHGAYSGQYGVSEKAPGICSEAVCRVPMIWRAPGVTRAGHVASQSVEDVHIAPTIADLCGLEPMRTVAGTRLAGLLRVGENGVSEVAVTENAWSKALRGGP